MKLSGKVQAGKLIPDDLAAWAICLRHFEGKRVAVEMDTESELRSNPANKRYWAAIVPLVRHVIDEDRKEKGQEPIAWHPSKWKDDIHERLVLRHAGVTADDTLIGPVRKHTSKMGKREFYLFTESISRWLAEECGYYVPELGEDEMSA